MSAPVGQHDAGRRTRVIAVTGGKGGIGKTTVSINLAAALAAAGRSTLLLDADLGLANVDVLLGITPRHTLSDVMDGHCTLSEAMLDGPCGMRIVPGASGIKRLAELDPLERAGLIHAFGELERQLDVMVVDTAAGIAANTLDFCSASHEVLVVVCDDPASLTDAYATIKVLNQSTRQHRFRALVNMAQSEADARRLYARLQAVCDRYLDITLDYAGHIPFDPGIPASLKRRHCLVERCPGSAAGLAFKKLAQLTANWPAPRSASGRVEFFVERMARVESLERVAQV